MLTRRERTPSYPTPEALEEWKVFRPHVLTLKAPRKQWGPSSFQMASTAVPGRWKVFCLSQVSGERDALSVFRAGFSMPTTGVRSFGCCARRRAGGACLVPPMLLPCALGVGEMDGTHSQQQRKESRGCQGGPPPTSCPSSIRCAAKGSRPGGSRRPSGAAHLLACPPSPSPQGCPWLCLAE